MPSFRTKRGRCHLDDDMLRLESSFRGQLRRYREGNRLFFWAYVAAMLTMVGVLVGQLLAGETRTLLLTGGAIAGIVLLARVTNRLRGFTADEEIPIDVISHVTAVRGTKRLTRPRFVVAYDADGERKRRYVMMPSLWLSYGEAEFRRATATFREAGIGVDGASS
jgi:hypothetical protein